MIVLHEHKPFLLFAFVLTNCGERIELLGGRTGGVGEVGEGWE